MSSRKFQMKPTLPVADQRVHSCRREAGRGVWSYQIAVWVGSVRLVLVPTLEGRPHKAKKWVGH